MSTKIFASGCVLLAVLCALLAEPEQGVAQNRWDWSGSIATNFRGYIREFNKAGELGMNTFTLEAAQKISYDLSDHAAVNVKTCVSCHGFEVGQAYAEVFVHDMMNFEIGRFMVPFGEFNSRHDPSNFKTASKPLPYMMGHMVRPLAHNYSILMTPYVDNGINMFGSYWPNGDIQLAYSLYLVNGLKGTNDFNWIQSADYRDNNPFPVGGARVVIAPYDLFTLGGSFMAGEYNNDSDLAFWIAGGQLTTRIKSVNFAGEYLYRKTEVRRPGPAGALIRDDYNKSGFYGQIDFPAQKYVEFVGRVDGMLRKGAVVGQALDDRMGILRFTTGVNVTPETNLVLKANYEFWHFTDFDDIHMINLQVVLTY